MALLLKSGDLAKQAEVSTETLRYYEREGLLAQPERSEAGYRLYPADAVRRVRFIKRGQELGFTLKEVRELLTLKQDCHQSAAEVKQMTEHKIQVINDKIQALEAIKAALTKLAEACPGEQTTVDHCPILNCLNR